MPEQVQKILNKIIDWWKAFSTKQKILLTSLTATVILALVILAVILSQPKMTELVTCETTAQAAEVKDLLDENGIEFDISDDNLTFLVDEKDLSNAALLLGQNSIPATGYSIDNVFDGGFSTTEADKTKKYQKYLEEHYAESLELFENVESAQVNLELPDEDGTILAKEEEASATAILTLSDEMDADQAYGIAKFLATNLGNTDTANIVIMDSGANVLYSGADSASAVGTASTQLSLREKAENQIIDKVKKVIKDSSICDDVEVAAKLDMNFDESTEATHSYTLPDGQSAGLPSTTYDYESNAVGGEAATPGTDSNDDDTTYVMEDGEYTESSVTESKRELLYDETITNTTSAVGTYNYDDSSISLVTTNYVLYSEDVLKANGELDEMTFEEYKAANGGRVKTEVDEELYQMVANATGFPVENITIMSYDEPVFEASSGSGRSLADYLQIALAVLIFAVLGFVVFRSTRGEKEPELEEELSVESLLESTKESQSVLEDIGFNEKSETRILIEKFVEENPEAVASLLRNWLNEEWE